MRRLTSIGISVAALGLSLIALALPSSALAGPPPPPSNPCTVMGTTTSTRTHNGSVKTMTVTTSDTCGKKGPSCSGLMNLTQTTSLLGESIIGGNSVTGTAACGSFTDPCTFMDPAVSCGGFASSFAALSGGMSCSVSAVPALPGTTVGANDAIQWSITCHVS